MSKRIQLIKSVRYFHETQMISHVGDWDYCIMNRYLKVIEQLTARLPNQETTPHRINSQHKLF